MALHDLVAVSTDVRAVSGRLEKIARIAQLLARANAGEAEIAATYLTGRLRQGRIGIGGAMLREARTAPAANATLTLQDVDQAFSRIEATTGKGSTAERGRLLHDLLSRATSEEQEFLTRLIFGELRQGALEGLMIDAVAKAFEVPVAAVRRAVMAEGRIGVVAAVARREGEAGLARYAIELFRPVRPMLAQTAEDVGEAIDRLGEAAFEYKLDGARVQAHKQGEEVRVYSRRGNEVTPAVPEVVAAVQSLPAGELIVDGEAIALRAGGMPHPFQTTMRRFGRKLDVDEHRASLPLSLFLFDLLYADGEALIDAPLATRAERLQSIAGGGGLVVPRIVTADPGEAARFLDRSLEAGHEGIMAKDPRAGYEAGSRGFGWLKVKRAETLDLVVLAAEWGNGRRQGWLSNLHLGARDPEHGGFVMLGKTFKGMTDAMLQWQTEKFLSLEIGRDSYTVFVKPEVVVEIAFGDIQASPRYPAGLALRFARVKRYRTDKTPEQADTIDRVRQLRERSRP
ncbi:MAG: ATP-dependent DNA ligase [Candidatus Eisenbacteria bacterium]